MDDNERTLQCGPGHVAQASKPCSSWKGVWQSDHEKAFCHGNQIASGRHCPDLITLLHTKPSDIGSSIAIASKSPHVVCQAKVNARVLSNCSAQDTGSQIRSKVISENEFAARCDTENSVKANAAF